MDTPEAQAQWEAWREVRAEPAADLPRAAPAALDDEPPALVLLRDHFGVMIGGAVLFSSLLFVVLMFATREHCRTAGRKASADAR